MKVDTGCIKNLAKHYFGGRLADRAAVRVPYLALYPHKCRYTRISKIYKKFLSFGKMKIPGDKWRRRHLFRGFSEGKISWFASL
jgi:hypothetical protein